jgi:TRAP-type mannitol/chloroaromatic compound transport system permease small subunit
MERPDVGGRVRWWITAVFVAGFVLLALHYGLRII